MPSRSKGSGISCSGKLSHCIDGSSKKEPLEEWLSLVTSHSSNGSASPSHTHTRFLVGKENTLQAGLLLVRLCALRLTEIIFQYGAIKQIRKVDASKSPPLYFLTDLKGKEDQFSYYYEVRLGYSCEFVHK